MLVLLKWILADVHSPIVQHLETGFLGVSHVVVVACSKLDLLDLSALLALDLRELEMG
jgi:hypothetical protein